MSTGFIVEIESIDQVVMIEESAVLVEIADAPVNQIVEVDCDNINVFISDAEVPDMEVFIGEIAGVEVELTDETIMVVEVACDVIDTGGGNNFFEVGFNYQSPPTLHLLNMLNGDILLDAELYIEEAFDDPNATLSVGTAADPECIITESENCPDMVSATKESANKRFTVAEIVRLFIDPGVSTQGSGYITLTKM